MFKRLFRYCDNLIGWAFGAVGIAIGYELGKDVYHKVKNRNKKEETPENVEAQN